MIESSRLYETEERKKKKDIQIKGEDSCSSVCVKKNEGRKSNIQSLKRDNINNKHRIRNEEKDLKYLKQKQDK